MYFWKMVGNFSNVTKDDVLNNISEKELLENGSVAFRISEIDAPVDEDLNVEFEIVEEDKKNPLDTVIKVTNVEII